MTERLLRALVDRIEGDVAVLVLDDESRQTVDWPVSGLPEGAGEGSILAISLRTDTELQASETDELSSLIDRLERGE